MTSPGMNDWIGNANAWLAIYIMEYPTVDQRIAVLEGCVLEWIPLFTLQPSSRGVITLGTKLTEPLVLIT